MVAGPWLRKVGFTEVGLNTLEFLVSIAAGTVDWGSP